MSIDTAALRENECHPFLAERLLDAGAGEILARVYGQGEAVK